MSSLLRLYLDWRFRRSTWVDQHGIRWVKTTKTSFGTNDFVRASVRLRRKRLTAKEYLRRYQNEFPWGKLWLEHGTDFPAPTKALCADFINGNALGPEGSCYRNALHFSNRLIQCKHLKDKPIEKSILYVEGLAVDMTGVYPHAWLSVDGRVVDITWPGAYLTTYYGIAFDPLWARKLAEKIGKIGMVCEWDKFEPYVHSKLKEKY